VIFQTVQKDPGRRGTFRVRFEKQEKLFLLTIGSENGSRIGIQPICGKSLPYWKWKDFRIDRTADKECNPKRNDEVRDKLPPARNWSIGFKSSVEEILVGDIEPLTGPLAFSGHLMRNGQMLAGPSVTYLGIMVQILFLLGK